MPEMPVRRLSRVVHGHRRAWLQAGPPLGTAPVLLLVHGVGDSSQTWSDVLPLLARTHTVLAPDLLGHGASAKPRADYSLGGFANGMRDLLVVLGVERVSIVGHSLGGGVALQFAYQYPSRVERLILVSSGGLGAEVHPVLRAAALPGAAYGIAVSVLAPVRVPLLALARLASRAGLADRADVDEVAVVWKGLQDPSTRAAFLRTLRSVIDLRGQSVTSRDRLYLTGAIPTLLVWGERDPVLPVEHAHRAAAALPGARLEVLPRAGHLPHRSSPVRFTSVLQAFLRDTAPAQHDAVAWRSLVRGSEPDADLPDVSRHPAAQV